MTVQVVFPDGETRSATSLSLSVGDKIFITIGELATGGKPYIVTEIKHIFDDSKDEVWLHLYYTQVIVERAE